MSRWFRHYAGMMRDDKLVRVSIRTKQTIERVAWVWGAILESAAEIDDAGRYDFDAAEAAYFLRADEADIHAIEAGLADAGRLAAGIVVKWSDRQFKSDRSASRQADYRERKRAENRGSDDHKTAGDDGVTSLSRHGDAPETELDTEKEKKEVTADAATYAFEGKVIRLKPADLARWQASYSEVDVRANLQSRDDWLATEADAATRKKWFVSTSNHLATLQRKARETRWQASRVSERLTI